jgi:hypothetical protein
MRGSAVSLHLPRRPASSSVPRARARGTALNARTLRGGRCVAMSGDGPKVVGLTGSIGMGKSTVSGARPRAAPLRLYSAPAYHAATDQWRHGHDTP